MRYVVRHIRCGKPARPDRREGRGQSLVPTPILQTSLKQPIRLPNKDGFNFWKQGVSERVAR
jgi:hypothetical protein